MIDGKCSQEGEEKGRPRKDGANFFGMHGKRKMFFLSNPKSFRLAPLGRRKPKDTKERLWMELDKYPTLDMF